MIGLLLFLVTIPVFPHILFAAVAIYALFFRWRDISSALTQNKGFVVGLVIFIIGGLINFLVHTANQTSNEVPYFLAMPLSILIAYAMRKQDLRIFLFLLCIEVGVGAYELVNGIQTVFQGVTDETINLDEDLLYYRTVFGLSVGSNSFAFKLLFGMICIDLLYRDWTYKSVLLKIVLLMGLVMSFNRTTIIAYCVYQVVYFCVWPNRLPFKKEYRVYILLLLALLVGGIVFKFREEISAALFEQFTRGRGEFDLSGRPLIWSEFLTFIDAHLWFGNGSFRVLVPYYSGMIHAHNSFLQVIANNGILLGGFLIVLTLAKLNKKNIVYIVPLLVYSLTQYGIFWGTSLTDVVFFALLCKPSLYVGAADGNLTDKMRVRQ